MHSDEPEFTIRGVIRGFKIQGRNARALMLRDMMVRYGRENIGFVWLILEPMILTVGVMIFWTITAGSTKHGVKVVEFILTGYMPLTLWRHLTNSMITLFRRSAGLLYHRTISLLDLVYAKAALEFLATTMAFLVMWGVLYSIGFASGIADLGTLMIGWFMMAWLAVGTGFIFAAGTEYSETFERFIQPFQYLSIPLSGAFTLVDWLPMWAQEALLLNPMTHCYEVFRAGFFGPTLTTHYSYVYFSAWAFAILFVGIVLVDRTRDRVQLD